MKKLIYGYDLETFPNIFTAVFIDKKEEFEPHVFEISERKNELSKMLEFLKSSVKGLIGYNNLHFDSQILEWFINNRGKLLNFSHIQILSLLMVEVDSIIDSKFPRIPSWELKIPNLDIYKYMHYNRFGVSLKWCEYMLDAPNLEDLPHEPGKNVPIEDFDILIDYNINDVVETLRVFNYSRESVNLRKTLSKVYHRNLMNESDTGIGKTIMLNGYSKISGKSSKDIRLGGNTERSIVNFKNIIDDRINFQTDYLKLFLEGLKENNTNLVYEKFKLKVKTLTCEHEMAKGGLHSICRKGIYKESEDNMLLDVDFGSFYPNIMIQMGIYPKHLGEDFLIFLKELTDRRLKAKKEGDTITNKSLKISINSIYGLLGEVYSFIHDYKAMFSVTINGQLLLLMLIEQIELIDPRIKCYYSNTDGATFTIPRELKDEVIKSCDQYRESIINIPIEYEKFSKQILSDVNNFLVVKTDGSLKEKGKFISNSDDLPLNKNKSFMCVPKAVREYYVNGTPVSETLRKNNNIFDFCAGKRAKKTPKSNRVIFEMTNVINGTIHKKQLSKTIRYYVSKKGGLLQKVFYDEDGSILKTEMVEAYPKKGGQYNIVHFNKFVKKENYDLDYKFYERMCNRIIHDIVKDENQLELF